MNPQWLYNVFPVVTVFGKQFYTFGDEESFLSKVTKPLSVEVGFDVNSLTPEPTLFFFPHNVGLLVRAVFIKQTRAQV